MASDPPPPIVVNAANVDPEKQQQQPAEDKKKGTKDNGVIVTVQALPVFDSSDTTPANSTFHLPISERPQKGQEKPAEDEFPEGGLRAWLVVFGGWCGLFGSMGIINSISVFNAYISTNQLAAYPPSTTGWIWSLFMFLALFPGIFVGPVFDTYGPTYLVGPGSALLVLGLLLTSFATQYWHFILSFSVLCGVGASMVFSPSIAAAGHWFRERRSMALGLVGTGAVASGIVMPFFLQGLLPAVGYGWTMRALALFLLAFLGAATLLVRTRLPPAPRASMLPDLRIFRGVPFLLTTLGDFFMELAIYTPNSYLSAYALAAGHGQSMAFAVVSVLNGASVIGRAAPGFITPLIGPFNAILVFVLVSCVAVIGILFPAGKALGGLVAFAVLYGLSTGATMTLTPLCVGQLCDTRSFGRYYAGMYVVVSWGYLFGTPLGGVIISAKGYGGLFVFAACIYGVSMALYGTVRVMIGGWGMKKV